MSDQCATSLGLQAGEDVKNRFFMSARKNTHHVISSNVPCLFYVVNASQASVSYTRPTLSY